MNKGRRAVESLMHQPEPAKSGKNARPPQVSASLAAVAPEKFGFEEARHLLWRAGFGGTPEQIQTLAQWGPQRSVDHLVNYESIPYDPVNSELFDSDIMRPPNADEREMLARARRSNDEDAVARFRARRQEAERDDREQMRRTQHWWMKRMIESPRPLEEKMTLFWHGHFATSYRTIENSFHMFVQNQLFRKHATGDFRQLLFGIIRDPAMLAYLDNNDSRKGRPNENLARELMELFSLGVGNYTEQDIKEGARCLTGYTFNDDAFVFNEGNHDDGRKTVLGKSGTFDGEDFVTAILEQRACSQFIATKLYRFFVAEYPTGRESIDTPAKAAIREIASSLLRSKYQLKPVLTRLFLSEHFYDRAIANEMIKSPVELVVGAVRSLNTPVRELGVLVAAVGAMGQNIFYPPSVKGWDGGRSWVNTSTLFIRQNILCYLLTGKLPVGYDALSKDEPYDPAPLLAQLATMDRADQDPERVVEYILRFSLGTQATRNRETLRAFIKQHGDRVTPEIITGLLLLVTAMPEYQLC
jgi:uncharacterized protein (DUF1800 family)